MVVLPGQTMLTDWSDIKTDVLNRPESTVSHIKTVVVERILVKINSWSFVCKLVALI